MTKTKKKKVQKGTMPMMKVVAQKADGQKSMDRRSYSSFGKSRTPKGRSK